MSIFVDVASLKHQPQRSRLYALLCGLILSPLFFGVSDAGAANKYLEIVEADEAQATPAYRYANMTNAEAFAELDRRRIPYEREPGVIAGVRAAIRLTGKLRGVHIHSVLPENERAETVFEILDARLALALDDLCKILQNHDVVEIVHFTMYRPHGEKKVQKGEYTTRHPGGLAIDLGAMKKANGDWMAIGPHWSSSIGSKTCGTEARKLVPRRGRELVSILCEAADQRLFHYMLSPHFDEAHGDHFHLEIKPKVTWFLVN